VDQDLTSSDAPAADPVASSTSQDDGDFVSLEELQAMGEDDLRQFIKDNELTPPTEATTKQDLLDWLLSEFGATA
jgi:hypothetical protein